MSPLRLFSLTVGCLALGMVSSQLASAQAPNPPPIWPAQFIARFGLYMFDGLPSESPIFNETSIFSYNIDIDSQLIEYPKRCVPVLPHDENDQTSCKILFVSSGIYWSQPDLGVDCCLLIPGVGPTPRDFTRGFTWNKTASAIDYYGNPRNSDVYISDDASFKYWTEVAVAPVTAHKDVLFRDGSGAFWAWDKLQVVPVPASTFAPFADPATCAVSCDVPFNLTRSENAAMVARARKMGMIQLAAHHHDLQAREAREHPTPKPHHHHAKGPAKRLQKKIL